MPSSSLPLLLESLNSVFRPSNDRRLFSLPFFFLSLRYTRLQFRRFPAFPVPLLHSLLRFNPFQSSSFLLFRPKLRLCLNPSHFLSVHLFISFISFQVCTPPVESDLLPPSPLLSLAATSRRDLYAELSFAPRCYPLRVLFLPPSLSFLPHQSFLSSQS